ncbi:MAG: hypothetical protein H0Z34_12215 [Brevibacillus sp.]|nr:hypothetical protein [Brevibacillus sp.]
MLAVGDWVKFALDGALGVVLDVRDDRCQVMWEDYFVSWEKRELLLKLEQDKEEKLGW